MTDRFQIHPNTQIAHLELQVVDLAKMRAFYGDLMGFRVIENGAGSVRLSATGEPPALITLTERKDAKREPDYHAGLYHTAFRFPDRRALGAELMRIVAAEYALQGASDHRVSEAIYFADPEGNGIEIYRDRARTQWPRLQDSIQMGNAPLDLRALLEEADQEQAKSGRVHPETDIGHMHLQVSNLETAKAFYNDLLGLDVMMELPTALFMSAGGYHHHLGANIWNSRGAPPRDETVTGLRSYAYLVPDEKAWNDLKMRLEAAGKPLTAVERDGRTGFAVRDQDGITVEVLTSNQSIARRLNENEADVAISNPQISQSS